MTPLRSTDHLSGRIRRGPLNEVYEYSIQRQKLLALGTVYTYVYGILGLMVMTM